jgi:hypothetical protein
MRHYSPPAFACLLLESLLPGPYREALLGDLVEEYRLRIESASPFTASRWFWSQACRSVPPMVWSSLRSNRLIKCRWRLHPKTRFSSQVGWPTGHPFSGGDRAPE